MLQETGIESDGAGIRLSVGNDKTMRSIGQHEDYRHRGEDLADISLHEYASLIQREPKGRAAPTRREMKEAGTKPERKARRKATPSYEFSATPA